MDFEKASSLVRHGRLIRRTKWGAGVYVRAGLDGRYLISVPQHEHLDVEWIPYRDDIYATDWEEHLSCPTCTHNGNDELISACVSCNQQEFSNFQRGI